MSNVLISEIDAMINRLDIIVNNTGDKETAMVAKDVHAGISQMAEQVKSILNPEVEK